MSKHSLYLVCYDISDPVRLSKVHHFLKGYKVGGQKSFFECWLTLGELRSVKTSLQGMIDLIDDRIHIFQLDPRMESECLGTAKSLPVDTPFIIV